MKPIKKRKRKFRWDRFFSLIFIAALLGGVTVFAVDAAGKYEPVAIVFDDSAYSEIPPETVITATVNEVFNDSDGVEPHAAVFADDSAYIDIQFNEDGVYPVETVLKSAYVIVYDVTAKEVLFEKSSDKKCFPASTTKLLTAAVLLDTLPEDHLFTVGSELSLVKAGSSVAMLSEGNVLDMPTMIDALMLPSGNDAAYVAAVSCGRYIAGDENLSPKAAVEVFMNRCNEVLHNIGASETHFSVPDGFHDEDHYTTAADMLRISIHAMEYPLILESADKTYTKAVFVSGESIEWKNSNVLIYEGGETFYHYARGLKTGRTQESGYCVSALATRYGHDVICVTLGAESSDIRWTETISLLDSAFVHIKNNINGET
jgi:D-alanyl-D-alanine carboxypeptidase (penicillin-binding protein 5/6)